MNVKKEGRISSTRDLRGSLTSLPLMIASLVWMLIAHPSSGLSSCQAELRLIVFILLAVGLRMFVSAIRERMGLKEPPGSTIVWNLVDDAEGFAKEDPEFKRSGVSEILQEIESRRKRHKLVFPRELVDRIEVLRSRREAVL